MEDIFIAIPVIIMSPLAVYTHSDFNKLKKSLEKNSLVLEDIGKGEKPIPEEVLVLFRKVKKLGKLNLSVALLWILFGLITFLKR